MKIKYEHLPELEQIAFLEGIIARKEGEIHDTNPFLDNCREHKLWTTGWYLQDMREHYNGKTKTREAEHGNKHSEEGNDKTSERSRCPECGKEVSITNLNRYRFHKNGDEKCPGTGQTRKS